MDMTYFNEMESRIPRGQVRTRFAPSYKNQLFNLDIKATSGSLPYGECQKALSFFRIIYW